MISHEPPGRRHFWQYMIGTALLITAVLTIALLCRVYSENTVFSEQCHAEGSDGVLTSRALETFKQLRLSGAFSYSRGNTLLAKGFCGSANPKTRLSISSDTRFNIGSMSKQFTGYLLLELEMEKKLNLAQKVSEIVPELHGTKIGEASLRQLMTMTSGLPQILPLHQFLGIQLSSRIRTEAEFVSAIKNVELHAKPGDQFLYSNLGYSLLSVVIGRIEQSSWSAALERRIFSPFGMIRTTTEGERAEAPNGLAKGLFPFTFLGKNYFLALPHWNYSMIKGAGAIVSTVDDLSSWNQALWLRSQRDPAWATKYFPKTTGDYSFGWAGETLKGTSGEQIFAIEHDGEDPGYCGLNFWLPSSQIRFVATLNSDYCLASGGKVFQPFVRIAIEKSSSQ